jgi:hypothetical protein
MSVPEHKLQEVDCDPQEFEGVWAGGGDRHGDPLEIPHGESPVERTVEEAAKILGITTKAVIKRLQRKSLPGKKIEVKGVEQWRVLPGDWTRDTQPEAGPDNVDPTGDPQNIGLSRADFLQGLEELKSSIQRDFQAPQVVLDRSEEIERIQKQLINAQSMVIALQHENKEQAVALSSLEGELKLLPDLEAKATEYELVAAELKTKEKRIQELESLLAQKNRGLLGSVAGWFKWRTDNQ